MEKMEHIEILKTKRYGMPVNFRSKGDRLYVTERIAKQLFRQGFAVSASKDKPDVNVSFEEEKKTKKFTKKQGD